MSVTDVPDDSILENIVEEDSRTLVNQIQAILVSRDAQTDAERVEMSTQMEPEKESKETQAGCLSMEPKSTQTESRLEELKIQRLVQYNTFDTVLDNETLETLTRAQVPSLDLAAAKFKAHQPEVHKTMLKLLNEEPAK